MRLRGPFSAELRESQGLRLGVMVAMGLLGVLLAFPIAWMLSNSLKSPEEALAWPPKWIPSSPQWSNFGEAVRAFPYFRYLFNTVALCLVNVVASLISSSLVAYGLTGLKGRAGRRFERTIVAASLVPFPVLAVPLFVVFKEWGAINSFLPLWIPSLVGIPFHIMVMIWFFRQVPAELVDAMALEGAGETIIFWRVYLPLAGQGLALVALFQFIETWHAFLGPLLFLQDPDMATLSLGLYQLQARLGSAQWQVLMAAAALSALPVLLVFLASLRLFERGSRAFLRMD